MRKFKFLFTFLLIFSLIGINVFADNGAPNGAHYNLNIIGVSNPKTADMTGTSGHVIFVPITGKTKIELMEAPEGESFSVLDANGTDGVAIFQLPNPDLDPYNLSDSSLADTISAYSVYVRPLGKPGGWTTITTCAELVDTEFAGLLSKTFSRVLNGMDGDAYASIEQVGQTFTERVKGKTEFANVTAELLTILFKVEVIDELGETYIEYIRVPIFSEIIQGEYWDYDNNNLKLLQIRFYPIGTDVSENDLLFD